MNRNMNKHYFYQSKIILDLPRSEKQKKQELFYAIFIFIMIFMPLIMVGVSAFFNHLLVGILILVICYTLLAFIGIYMRKRAVDQFYILKDAHTKFQVVDVDDIEIIKDLYANSALTFSLSLEDAFLDFVYNWLYHEGVLKSEFLHLYIFDWDGLKEAFPKSQFGSQDKFMSIFLKDLDLNDSNRMQFSRNHFTVGARWFDDMIDNDQ